MHLTYGPISLVVTPDCTLQHFATWNRLTYVSSLISLKTHFLKSILSFHSIAWAEFYFSDSWWTTEKQRNISVSSNIFLGRRCSWSQECWGHYTWKDPSCLFFTTSVLQRSHDYIPIKNIRRMSIYWHFPPRLHVVKFGSFFMPVRIFQNLDFVIQLTQLFLIAYIPTWSVFQLVSSSKCLLYRLCIAHWYDFENLHPSWHK